MIWLGSAERNVVNFHQSTGKPTHSVSLNRISASSISIIAYGTLHDLLTCGFDFAGFAKDLALRCPLRRCEFTPTTSTNQHKALLKNPTEVIYQLITEPLPMPPTRPWSNMSMSSALPLPSTRPASRSWTWRKCGGVLTALSVSFLPFTPKNLDELTPISRFATSSVTVARSKPLRSLTRHSKQQRRPDAGILYIQS